MAGKQFRVEFFVTDVDQIWRLFPVGRLEVFHDGFGINLVYRDDSGFLGQVQVVVVNALGRVDDHEVVQGLKAVIHSTYAYRVFKVSFATF